MLISPASGPRAAPATDSKGTPAGSRGPALGRRASLPDLLASARLPSPLPLRTPLRLSTPTAGAGQDLAPLPPPGGAGTAVSVRPRLLEPPPGTDAVSSLPREVRALPPAARLLTAAFGVPVPETGPAALEDLAQAWARDRCDLTLAGLLDRAVIGPCAVLDRPQLAALLRGVMRARGANRVREACIDRLLARGAECSPRELGRLVAALVAATDGLQMVPFECASLLRLVRRGVQAFDAPRLGAVLSQLARSLGGPAIDAGFARQLARAMCESAGAVGSADECRRRAHWLGEGLGGTGMTVEDAGVVLEEALAAAHLEPELVGAISLGLADALAGVVPADQDAGASLLLPSLAPLFECTEHLSSLGLARWSRGCAEALREAIGGPAAAQALVLDLLRAVAAEQAAEEAAAQSVRPASLFTPGRLTSLGLGIACGLGEGGRPSIRVARSLGQHWDDLAPADLAHGAALRAGWRQGVALAREPLVAALAADPSPAVHAWWLDLAWSLDGALDADRVQVAWDGIAALPPAQAVPLREVLVRHGLPWLSDAQLQKAGVAPVSLVRDGRTLKPLSAAPAGR